MCITVQKKKTKLTSPKQQKHFNNLKRKASNLTFCDSWHFKKLEILINIPVVFVILIAVVLGNTVKGHEADTSHIPSVTLWSEVN